ncbi:MAG: S8 family peptidase [Bacteroidota bacterium]
MKKVRPFLPVFALLFLPHLMHSIGDPARQEIELPPGLPSQGQNMIVAVIDRGIDYFHPDFINPDGTTRIAYLYDMIDPSGANAPNNPYGIGTIFDATQINGSLQNSSAPLSTDRFGHGTATASIAAGNASQGSYPQFAGVASEATLIIVKVTHDPFPAFADQPGQMGFFDPTYIPVALEFVADKVAEIGQQSVTLINLGSIGGPTDGTSLVARAMTDFVEDGHHLVCGVGDDGGANNVASGNIAQNEMGILTFQKEAGFVRLDLWYSENDRFGINIIDPAGNVSGSLPVPNSATGAEFQTGTNYSYFHRGAEVDFFGSTSDRREMLIDFTGIPGEYTIEITGDVIIEGDFIATLNPARYNNNNAFTSFITPGFSINDYAAAPGVITPTDYVIKNDWVDINGNQQDITGQGETGELWIGSSEGPTHDLRQGVDIALPGEVLFAAYSPNTWYSNFSSSQVQGGDGNYGLQNAVSAAAPLLTGSIAVILQAWEERYGYFLSPGELLTLLHDYAVEDAFTGPTPNNTWGYGKFKIAPILDDILESTQQIYIPTTHLTLLPNPASSILNWQLDLETPVLNLEVLDLQGHAVFFQKGTGYQGAIPVHNLATGCYLLHIQTEAGNITKRFLVE